MKLSLDHLKNKIDYALLLALLIPLFTIMPLLTHQGLPNTADGPVHLMRQVELNQAWAEGNFYPRWGTDLALGHGMPIFSYAPPWLYQLTQLFHLTGLPLDESLKAVLILDLLLYSLGMFLFIRRIYGLYPALLAATLYVYAPYRLREAYIQGNYGQFTGLVFYPLICWGFHGLITTSRTTEHTRYWLAASISLAGLLLSHNISSMIFAPLLAAYLLFLLLSTSYQREQNQKKTLPPPPYALRFTKLLLPPLFRTITAGLLGLSLSAISWLPAFAEQAYIKLEGITKGPFDFRENFISLSEFLSPPLPLDLSAINPEFPLSLGLAQIIGATAGIMALLYLSLKLILSPRSKQCTIQNIPQPQTVSPKSQIEQPSVAYSFANLHFAQAYTHTVFFVVFFLLYTFLTLPISQSVWENVPLIELAEFPWRMLGPIIFCAAALSAATLFTVFYQISVRQGQALPDAKIRIGLLGLIIIIIGLNAYYLYPSQFIIWGTPTPADAFAYEAASGAIGTTSTGEFLPRWAQQHPQPETLWPDYEAGRPPQLVAPATLPPGATATNSDHRAESDTIHINTPQPFKATLRSLYWPGWQIYLNHKTVPFNITAQTGLMQVDIPAGEHTLTLQLESTPLRRLSLGLTLLAGLIILGLVMISFLQKNSPASQNLSNDQTLDFSLNKPTTTSSTLSPKTFILIAALFLALYLFSRPLSLLFTLQSDPNHPQPADRNLEVDFADQIRLVGVDTWPPEIERPTEGEVVLNVVLYWKAQQPLETNYAIFLHLDAPNGQTLATIDEVNPENIPTRNWPPGLYLRNPVQLKIPADLPPIRYNLTVGVYNRENNERLPLASGEGTALNLGPLWLIPPSSGSIPAPIASFGPHITLHRAALLDNNLTLQWQSNQPLDQNYTIFVHVLDQQGNLLNQADGVPYNGLYPLPHWLPGQLIEDTRSLDLKAQHLSNQPTALVIGIYNPDDGQRLGATDAQGQPLPHNAYLLPVIP